jgi:hypothetical protein
MPEETGATAVIEAPVTTTPTATPDASETTSQVDKTQTESSQATDKTQQTDKTDRRNNPDALRKTLKWLRENGGEHSAQAQEIERALGELKSWKTVATNVREAREIKAAYDAIGGREKLAEMQQYTTRMREVDSLIESGDERALSMILESPEMTGGVAKLLPGIMRELAKTHSAELSAAIRPQVAGFLDSEGLTDAIDAMVGHFNSNEPAKAKEVLAKIVNWYKNKMGQADGATSKPAEQQAWEKERDSFQQKAFSSDVAKAFDSSMTHAEQCIDREMAGYLKQYNIPKETAEIVRGDVWKRIEKERNADPLFKARIADMVNERSRKVSPETADFLKSQIDQRVKDAVRKEIQLRYGFIKKNNAPTTETKTVPTAAPTTGVSVSIDYGRTFAKYGGEDRGRDAIIKGKAVNAAGKDIVKVGRIWKLA